MFSKKIKIGSSNLTQSFQIFKKWRFCGSENNPFLCLKSTKSKNWNKFFYQNVWKTISNFFTLIDFCVSLIFFLNSKKNGEKVRPKSQKVQHWDNFERFKMVFWKIFQRRNIFTLLFFFHFLLFFWFMNTQKAQKLEQNMRILSSSKRGLRKKCWICCKNSTNVAKIFPIILWYLVYLKIFFLDVISTCSKEKPQKSWAINEKFSKDTISMDKHGWHPLTWKTKKILLSWVFFFALIILFML